MLKQSKKKARIFGLILFGLCFAFHFNSCKEADRASRIKPVEVAVSQKVSYSPFQAAIARFESQLAQDVAEDGVGSISAGVVAGNDLVWAKGFGWADIERKLPADKETIYRTGSISKSFTA
ncbi:MAG: serine hydrolase, partial [Candidatus Aminicenantes bacterium]|nr:serine hydrolase [Candidatus Aminicenantes bacterium]